MQGTREARTAGHVQKLQVLLLGGIGIVVGSVLRASSPAPALRGLLGNGARLSPSCLQRQNGKWETEQQAWQTRDLPDRERISLWADSLSVKAGLDRDRVARALLCQLPYAETHAQGERFQRPFVERYGRAYPKAVAALDRDWNRMMTVAEFPREHWKHLRTTNVIESPLAAVRLRTDAAKRHNRVATATALIWKFLMVAQSRFRRLDAPHLLTAVSQGITSAEPLRVSAERRGRVAASSHFRTS